MAGKVHLYHGKDEFSRTQAIEEMMAGLGEHAPLQTTLLEGEKLTVEQLISACDAHPLLGEKRLVIVRSLVAHLESGRKSQAKDSLLVSLVEYLPRLPNSTRLVFLESEPLEKDNPLLKALAKVKNAQVKEFRPPSGATLIRWTVKQVEEEGGDIEEDAAQELAAYVGGDLRQLDYEIAKLLAYVGQGRAIRIEDVHLLVSQAQEANIFTLVDALGEKDLTTAMEELHRLVGAGQHPLQILAMIIRQFRMLIMGKELQLQGEPLSKLGLHPFVARKVEAQARHFSRSQLEAIYQMILETDVGIKTGRVEPEVALDLLVTELATIPQTSAR